MNLKQVRKKQEQDLESFLSQKNRRKRGVNTTTTEGVAKTLLVDDFYEIKPFKVPPMSWKDGNKLQKLLEMLSHQMNRILKACVEQTQLTATELAARPTYIEEFNNIR